VNRERNFFMLLVFRFKIYAGRVHAVALSGLGGAVIKDVAQMTAAVGAEDLGADHPETPVLDIFNAALDGVVKAGPAAGALELLVALEQFRITGGTAVFSVGEVKVIFSGMRRFSSFLSKYTVLILRQLLLPLLFAPFYGISLSHFYFFLKLIIV